MTTSTSPQFTLEFDHGKNTQSFIDHVDSFPYIDHGLEYLQPFPQSPNYSVPIVPSPPIDFNSLGLSPSVDSYTYSVAPTRPYTPADGDSISPPALAGATYTLSAGELSSDTTIASHGAGHRSGSHSPPVASIPYASTIPRSVHAAAVGGVHRYSPVASPATRANLRSAHRKKMSKSNNEDSDDEDDEFHPNASTAGASADSRREAIRKQRIESEQRRRDELRDGYARLKDTLPASNQKSSKVSLLDRATSHLRYLDTVREQLENRLKAAEQEVNRLRNVNEALMLNSTRHVIGGGQPSF